jgi:hypothetical protein
MAETLKASDGKVVSIKTAKARGAGGAKGARKTAVKLKPTPIAKPDRPSADTPSELRARQAVVDRVAALTQQHRAMDHKIEAVDLTRSELNGQKKLIRTAIKNSGIRLEVFDERYEKLKLKTQRTDLAAIERERAICSEAMGLPAGEQEEMKFESLPEAARGAVYWEAEGYKACINNEPCDPVAAGVPPENTADYSRGFAQGTARNGEGLKQLKAEPAKPKPDKNAKAVAGQPDWREFADDPEVWSLEQRNVFRAWYESLDPAIDVDLEHIGVEAAFDKANDTGHAFEMSDAELAQQTTRRAVQEKRGDGEILN